MCPYRLISLIRAIIRPLSLSRFQLPDPMDCSPPGSSVYGVSQARILEWVAISSSRGSSRLRDQTHIYCISCTADSSPLSILVVTWWNKSHALCMWNNIQMLTRKQQGWYAGTEKVAGRLAGDNSRERSTVPPVWKRMFTEARKHRLFLTGFPWSLAVVAWGN